MIEVKEISEFPKLENQKPIKRVIRLGEIQEGKMIIRALGVGDMQTGKTTFGLTFPSPALVLTPMESANTVPLWKHLPNTPVYVVEPTPVANPFKYDHLKEAISAFDNDSSIESIILESIDGLISPMLRWVGVKSGVAPMTLPSKGLTFQMVGAMLYDLVEFLCTRSKHIYATAHIKTLKTMEGDVIGYGIPVPGAGTQEILYRFPFIFPFHVDKLPKKEPVFYISTSPSDKIPAKFKMRDPWSVFGDKITSPTFDVIYQGIVSESEVV